MLPRLTEVMQDTVFTQAFRGYNHNLRSTDGEFYAMKNITTDHYPVLTTRTGEDEKQSFSGQPNGMWEYEHDKLMVVAGKRLWVNITADSEGEVVQGVELEDSEKYFAQIGSKTVIMPDKVIYDSETNTVASIEKEVKTVTAEVGSENQRAVIKKEFCSMFGEVYDYCSGAEPEDDYRYWYDTTNNLYKQYNDVTEQWTIIDTPYMRLLPAVSTTIPGFTPPEESVAAEVEAKVGELSDYFGTLKDYDTVTVSFEADGSGSAEYVVFGKGTDNTSGKNFIVVVGDPKVEANEFVVQNKCPALTHICSKNNRIWGIDNEKHEIHACKLGDPTQWFNFPGLASDSYAVTLGIRDAVTGCCSYNNYVYFFTETKMLQVYGDYPSNFHVAEQKVDGVVNGGHKTIVVVEGILFYVSPVGVMSYDGSFPSVISHALAPHYLTGKTVVAGRDLTKYCLSISHNDEPFGVFMFDTSNRMWVIGGDQIFAHTAQLKNSLCFLNRKSKLVTTYDRSRTFDKIGLTGDELFVLDRAQRL